LYKAIVRVTADLCPKAFVDNPSQFPGKSPYRRGFPSRRKNQQGRDPQGRIV